jgi:hypothetical protein
LTPNTKEIEIPKRLCPDLKRRFWGKEPERKSDHERDGKMAYSVREPCDYVQEGVGEAGEDVGDVRAIKYGLKGRKGGDGDAGAP